MVSIKLQADVLAPDSIKKLSFTGHHPSRFLKIIPGLMKSIFRLSGSKFYEDKIKWDTSTPNTDFYGEWRGNDPQDNKTSVWVKVKVFGSQNSDKMGKINIELSAILQTKFEYSNLLEKSLMLLYSRLFYSEQRRGYIVKARRNMEELENELKKELQKMVIE
ncbi:MAG: hypothetical protein JW700_01185 [Candidatus Aenigmarchaeota archaeon]|nr:hypothetical protein [Candidatus Aenigmarchaeota archaeon]